jgi:hypothetical protein
MTKTEIEDQRYSEFKTELKIGMFGGLFIALYEDSNTPDRIINRLKMDLPEQFHFTFYIDPKRVWLPTYFELTFTHMGKKGNIFHVFGVEMLSDEKRNLFYAYVQQTREVFKSKPYSLVLWLTPELDNELYFNAPDFYHWVTTYDFTKLELEELSSPFDTAIALSKINIFLEKALWQYGHWQEVKDSGETFLIAPMERANLYEYYIKSYCTDKAGKTCLLDNYLNEFINDNSKNFLTLLGDFGIGKTSFAIHYFTILAKSYLKNPALRIPIFLSLKDYPGKLNIEDFIVKEFFHKFDIELSFPIFQDMALQGKFFFLIDGFDEMATVSNENLTIENFKELTKLTFESVLFMVKELGQTYQTNKVLLTSRTHYFLTETQVQDILKADYTILYRDYATKSTYEITRLHVKEFDDKQIEQYISKHTQDERATQKISLMSVNR